MNKVVTVRVPASSANLGPGFDAVGMALNLFNTIIIEESAEFSQEIEVEGYGETLLPRDASNLVCQTIINFFQRVKYISPGWKLRLINKIPIQRGLGSSSAAIVGGLVAANALAGTPYSKDELLAKALEIEGHPDNVAPAMLGGIVVGVPEKGTCVYSRFVMPEGLRVIAAVPSFTVSTALARNILPETVPRADAVFNVGRAALLVTVLRDGNWELLPAVLQDRLHQTYRAHLIPGLEEIFTAAKQAGAYGAVVSGAGPTVIAFAPQNCEPGPAMKKVFEDHGFATQILELEPSLIGVHVVEQ